MNLVLVLYAPPEHHADHLRALERNRHAAIARRRDGWLAGLRRVEIRRRVRPAGGDA